MGGRLFLMEEWVQAHAGVPAGGAGAGRLQTLGGAQLLLPFAPQGSPGSVSSFQLAPGKGKLGEQCWAHIWSQRRLRTTKTTCEWEKMWVKYWVVMSLVAH